MVRYIVVGNTSEWCKASWEQEIKTNSEMVFCNDKVPYSGNAFIKRLCEAHYSQKLNKKRNFFGKSIWYRNMAQTLGIDFAGENILIMYDWSRISRDFSFLEYLRKRCKKIKIVYLFTNVVRASGAQLYQMIDKLKKNYDAVFAFDKKDAKKYNFDYFPLIYTGMTTDEPQQYLSDLFYVGQAKDRYEQLLYIFEKAQKEGLICNFNIVGVPEDKQRYAEIINYKKRLPYEEVVRHINNSRCLIDAIQGNSTGMTIKVCESVVYEKKLITTNVHVKEEPFYSEKRIMIGFEGDTSIREFLDIPVASYTREEKAVFSPKALYEKIRRQYW